VQRRKVMDLKLAFSEFYLSLILLQNYQNLNFTGFRKILKKHDKLVKNDAGGRWREDYVECAHFHTNKVGAAFFGAGVLLFRNTLCLTSNDYPGSEFFPSRISDPGSASKSLSTYFNPKNGPKLWEI
jgi:hypothetical protein